MSKECWNSENLLYVSSEEFQYLDEIECLVEQAERIVRDLKDINKTAYWRIQCNDEKSQADFTEIKNKLRGLQKLIDEL